MPAISAAVIPVPGYVYVEGNFSDVGSATHACVERVDCLTGERSPLRPYVSFNTDGCLALSCGQGIWWDTEAPLDRCVYYCATVMNASGEVITQPADPLVKDTFTRTVAAGWGTADTGQAWTITSGLAADHSVNGTRGLHATTVVNSVYEDTINVGTPNATESIQVFIPAVATGAGFDIRLEGRRTDANNYYSLLVTFDLAGVVSGQLVKIVAGVQTFFTPVNFGTYTAGSLWNLSFTYWGSQLSAFWHDATTPAPTSPIVTATDTSLTTGNLGGIRSRRNAGNTNGTVTFQFDNYLVTDVCADSEPIETCSDDVTVPSNGCFRLGDPVRPCHDQVVCLEGGDGCVPGEGIYFGAMGREEYTDNSGQMLPVNARRPIVVSRDRRDVQSELTLVTATFGDRDDVLLLNEPGSPLLWRGPAAYGIPDRYMSVLDVTVDRGLSDHREEPRVISMPHWAVDSPVGPSQGVCGARVADLCDTYATWDAVIAAGLTWTDLLRGAAGGPGDVRFDPVTWSEVNAAYASWNALNAAESDWNDVWREIG
jgi:hypothetical protein